MRKLWAVMVKELLLLVRDRAGLTVLFLMPAVLVVVVSLVQENIMKATGASAVRILYIDHDGQTAGRMIRERLANSDMIALVPASKKRNDESDEASARQAMIDGAFQFCLIVPEGLSRELDQRVAGQIAAAFHSGKSKPDQNAAPRLTVLFDPLVQGAFRAAVINGLQGMALALEMEMKARAFSEMLPGQVERMLATVPGMPAVKGLFPPVDPAWGRQRLLTVASRQPAKGGADKLPSAVQQNVPAWALFGMFFIVVPMGGSLIRERQEGTLKRLLSLPVSYGVVLGGKVLTYVVVCLCQFGIIVVMGIWLLPMLGTAPLAVGSAAGAVAAVVVGAALAAAGYSILVGTLAGTYEQASMFGAVSVVIASAVGGVMVPVYAMPPVMQDISRISPLAWGLDALTTLFVREGTLAAVLPEIACLLLFALGTSLAGWWGFVYRERRG